MAGRTVLRDKDAGAGGDEDLADGPDDHRDKIQRQRLDVAVGTEADRVQQAAERHAVELVVRLRIAHDDRRREDDHQGVDRPDASAVGAAGCEAEGVLELQRQDKADAAVQRRGDGQGDDEDQQDLRLQQHLERALVQRALRFRRGIVVRFFALLNGQPLFLRRHLVHFLGADIQDERRQQEHAGLDAVHPGQVIRQQSAAQGGTDGKAQVVAEVEQREAFRALRTCRAVRHHGGNDRIASAAEEECAQGNGNDPDRGAVEAAQHVEAAGNHRKPQIDLFAAVKIGHLAADDRADHVGSRIKHRHDAGLAGGKTYHAGKDEG